MQVCLFNSTDKPIFVKEIGMTVGAKSKSRLLTEGERVAIVGDYPGLRFIDFMIEEKSKTKPEKTADDVVVEEPQPFSDESTKPKRKTTR